MTDFKELDRKVRDWFCPTCKTHLRTLPTHYVPTHRHGKNTKQIPFQPHDQED